MAPVPMYILPGGFMPPVALLYVVPGEEEPKPPRGVRSSPHRIAEDHWFVRLCSFVVGDRRTVR